MKKKIIYQISTLLLGLVLLAGCTEFEEFESVDLGDGPTLTINLVNAGDSSITVDLTSNAAGYIVAALMTDTTNEVPENKEALAKGNVVNEEYFYAEVDANETVTYTFSNALVQDALYEIMAVSADGDGVLSEINVLEVTTADTYAPAFVASYPGFTYDPVLAQEDTIVIEFNEMVMTGEGAFSIETFFTGQTVEVPEENVWAIENYVFVVLPTEFPYREYIWMHWEADAIVDYSGNGVDALTTYFDAENGEFIGAYWRMMEMEFAVASVTPDEAVAQDAGFDIVIDFGTGVSADDVADGDITLTYVDDQGITTVVPVPVADVSASGSEVTVMQSVFTPASGTVTIDVPAGVIFDGFGNPNAEMTATWTLN